MCGIFGLWQAAPHPVDPALVEQATSVLRHRGPDDEGYLLVDTESGVVAPYGGRDTAAGLDLSPLPAAPVQSYNLALGFRRLAILDLSPAGHQPMASWDGRCWIVFNGEIYNYLELRLELSRQGYAFRSQSDTEVLLAAYDLWGIQALPRLVGMFALALLDLRASRLLLARDFLGIKPLYYTWNHRRLAFASEIKALLTLPGIVPRVSPQRLYDYLRFQMTDHGGETLWADIHQLPAAHYLELPLSRPPAPNPIRYWQIDLNRQVDLSFSEAADRLRRLFLENVSLHLRSDVPVGTALSGGIDSSAIVMAMRKLQGPALELHTFSYIAAQPPIDEEYWVDLVGQAAGALIHKVRPNPVELAADLERLVRVQEEPFGSTSIYAQQRVFQLAHAAGIKVMLDGQGADELLAGYRPFLVARLASLLRQQRWRELAGFLPRATRLLGSGSASVLTEAAKLLLAPNQQAQLRRWFKRSAFPPWLHQPWFEQQGAVSPFQWNYRREILREQLHRAVTEISLPLLLRYEDRNSMAYSIESRVPFLTPALVEFIFALPETYLIAPDGASKAVFRQAMRGLAPAAVLDRQDKIGFATPEQEWLTCLQAWVNEVLSSEITREIPALNWNVVKAEWQAVLNRQRPFDFRIWRWLNLVIWVKTYGIRFS